ncbi:MAG: arginyltransferase [Zoogloeaceae bacterium]|jgi:arginine-tRNA-protein transferase|nr:arginyltransferase [Zoogloeaceae bacterium]
MSDPREVLSLLQFYTTAPFSCSYLPERRACSQAAVPGHLIDAAVYSQLVRLGFRRSGLITYRPHCDTCNACIPVRLPVDRLNPNRSQRRALKHHANLLARECPLRFDERHYALYARYQARRHTGGGMDEDNREQYIQFLLEGRVETRLIEFSDAEDIRMVSVIDVLDDGLSSVYTFFDPDVPGAAYGTYNVLWQARLTQQLNLPYLYLGYWIRELGKMAYKTNFRPIQGYVRNVWRDLSNDELI